MFEHFPAFPTWVSTTIYLHSRHPSISLHSLHGFPSMCTYIPCIFLHSSLHFSASPTFPCMGPLHHHIPTFAVFPVCVTFCTMGNISTTMYLHSQHFLCGSSPPCTYISCIHCMESTHCMGPHHHCVPTFPAWVQFSA